MDISPFWRNSGWRVLQADMRGIHPYNRGRVGVYRDMTCSVPVGCNHTKCKLGDIRQQTEIYINRSTSNSLAFPLQLHLGSSQCTCITPTSLRTALSGKTCRCDRIYRHTQKSATTCKCNSKFWPWTYLFVGAPSPVKGIGENAMNSGHSGCVHHG